MAAGILSRPGTKYGPCKEECHHKDCAQTREMAESICPKCGKKIGYKSRFFLIGTGTLSSIYAHADCCAHSNYTFEGRIMTCDKCGGLMTGQRTSGIQSFVCIFCGNCCYPAFPKRPAPGNICNACGEEYYKKDVRQDYCPTCRKLIGKNFNNLKQHMDESYEASLG